VRVSLIVITRFGIMITCFGIVITRATERVPGSRVLVAFVLGESSSVEGFSRSEGDRSEATVPLLV
jgi:hypothetical protein